MNQVFLQQKIRFKAIDDFTGQEIEREGVVVGNGMDVRKRWPEEMALAGDDVYLVEVEMPERVIHFAVHISEVQEILDE